MTVLMFGSWVLDHRSFFSLGQYVNEFFQIISFFGRSSFKLGCETVIGIVLCYSHQACCLLYYLCKINNGIHITSLPLNFYTSVSGCCCGFGFEQKYSGSTDLAKNRYGSSDFHTPILPSLYTKVT